LHPAAAWKIDRIPGMLTAQTGRYRSYLVHDFVMRQMGNEAARNEFSQVSVSSPQKN
jgi:hypothetical protein